MRYKNVNDILPHSLIRSVQQCIDDEYVYIPRKEIRKQAWGTNTGTKQRLLTRNREIIKRQDGSSVENTSCPPKLIQSHQHSRNRLTTCALV